MSTEKYGPRESVGIGRQARFRGVCTPYVRVRLPSLAPSSLIKKTDIASVFFICSSQAEDGCGNPQDPDIGFGIGHRILCKGIEAGQDDLVIVKVEMTEYNLIIRR